MRLLALLLLAAAVGFLVGRATAPEGRGRGGGRSAPAPLPGQPVAAVDQPPQVVEPPPPARIDELAPPADVVPSSEPAEDTGDDGLLLVDLCGVQRAWVGNVDIVGAYETEEIDAEENGSARFQGAAGTYDVWWLDRDGRRLGTRAKLDSGRVTRVRVTDHRTAPPIPRGLGVLGVFVEAAEGGGLCADVGIADGRHSMTVYTNADGYASTVIRPGRYLLSVGHRRSEAVVEEGRVAAHRIAHDGEGDLVLVADRMLDISLYAAGEVSQFCWTGYVGAPPGSTTTVPYLAAGEYDLFIPYSFGVPLGRTTIYAGRVTKFRCEPPKGGVLLRVRPESATVYIGPCRDLDGGTQEPEQVSSQFRAWQEPHLLMPGRYFVTAGDTGCEPGRVQFEVSDRVVEVTLELSPLR